jgi:2'-5' RNA ligase
MATRGGDVHTVCVQIQAVIEPPQEARDHLAAALAPYLSNPDLSWFLPNDWRARLATFGYLAFGDMVKLEDTLADQVSKQGTVRLRMRRIVPLPEERDDSVWVGLDGDVEELELLAQEIPGWVHGLGFLLDRYSFRPRIRLARVNAKTTVDMLEELIAGVGDYAGAEWTASSIQIVRRKPDGTSGELYRTHTELPLASATSKVPAGGVAMQEPSAAPGGRRAAAREHGAPSRPGGAHLPRPPTARQPRD